MCEDVETGTASICCTAIASVNNLLKPSVGAKRKQAPCRMLLISVSAHTTN